MKRKAIVVIDADDINVYFLVIDKESGKEINRYTTEEFGTFRCDDDYLEENVLRQISERDNIEIVSKIYGWWSHA